MSAPSVCVLGLGNMGAAMARRFREQGVDIIVWNRSSEKATALAAEDAPGQCSKADAATSAVHSCSEAAMVLLMLLDTAAVLEFLKQDGLVDSLKGKTLVNLTSGNPDEGRAIAKELNDLSQGSVFFIDGAYCGAPAKVRSGTGQLFLSSEPAGIVENFKDILSHLGSVQYCGGIGASRALDYGVVDLFFVNLLSFMSNAASLEREGVDMSVYFQEAAKRLATVPAALELYSKKMASREENAYQNDVTVTLGTSRSYWAGRLPYNEAHGIPSHLTNLFVELLDGAIGADGNHASADLSRLQEVVRFGKVADPTDSEHETK